MWRKKNLKLYLFFEDKHDQSENPLNRFKQMLSLQTASEIWQNMKNMRINLQNSHTQESSDKARISIYLNERDKTFAWTKV